MPQEKKSFAKDGSLALQPSQPSRFEAHKEEKKWKALGREVGEMDRHDIVFHSQYGFTEVVAVDGNQVMIEVVTQGKPKQVYAHKNELELISPKEQRFDQ